jgi:hypothetical protein
VQVLGQRCRQRQDVSRQLPHLLRHFQLRHGIADHRFVHVEMEEAHLRLGDPPHRLRVDADQLQEGHERKAGCEHAGAVPHRSRVCLADLTAAVYRRAEDDEDPLHQLRLHPRFLCHLLDRQLLLVSGEKLFGEAEGEPPLAPRRLQVIQRVTAFPHPRDNPRLRRGGRRPAPAPHRHDLLFRPPFEGAGGNAGAPSRLAQGDPLIGHQLRG